MITPYHGILDERAPGKPLFSIDLHWFRAHDDSQRCEIRIPISHQVSVGQEAFWQKRSQNLVGKRSEGVDLRSPRLRQGEEEPSGQALPLPRCASQRVSFFGSTRNGPPIKILKM